MVKKDIEQTIVDCIKPLIQAEQEINATTNLLELGMDSMNFIRLVVSLEEEFDIEIPDEEILLVNFMNVDSILGVVQRSIDAN
ncbi:acyl carrier protein [Cytobacillus pseudoceanisediminis]|uniref:acyl carrier protein n=1 Tax=Cytobacillus pseudoceanisediminis TaxID=3051614 RepID=UPI003C2F0186